ncbi:MULTISPECIES: hypothetical protein [unclassified Sphingomonas]|uniref:hypothetical protein n=1 Tax=unclassified Sphingomonas TaxID=196159 RepID=UPI0006F88A28|nr:MULTISPECIES: hypothetical protein [unclassified Sphingomonas]KQX20174.1 hypothetical protein ASD17_09845 [Sphingomonas sp. Root1294]KQY67424.1 hypothetical protein ASD39_09905 [Sphingomonas sp. Root50]KRB90801.1 hypothetical protein ASE22_10910 [Sphingomonas sp. Root720]
MNEVDGRVGIPAWYWVVGVVLLLWGAAGLFAFYSQLTTPYERMVAEMGKLAADCIKGMPGWLWWVYGVAVWSGVFGTIALLLRRAWAQPLYLISLAAVIVQFGHSFLIAKIHLLMDWSAAVFPAFIILMAVAQLCFAGHAKKRGWLR